MVLPIIDGLPPTWTAINALVDIDSAYHGGGSQGNIAEAGLMLTSLLLVKNAAYGDSALEPLSVFARDLTASERMAVRMDDKLNRITRGHAFGLENERIDLAGYLLLDYIAAHRSTT